VNLSPLNSIDDYSEGFCQHNNLKRQTIKYAMKSLTRSLEILVESTIHLYAYNSAFFALIAITSI